MIRSFLDKDTAKLAQGGNVTKWPPDVQAAARRKLAILAAATEIADLRVPPGNRLEKLSGERDGQYSIRVNDQWRICFNWEAPNADNVELVDYH